nr:uncharacterized protein LOC117280089 isoform X2 [Nicotiana tomentosiformis]
MKHKNKVHMLVLQAMPVIISWKIWRNWTSCKFGDQKRFVRVKVEQQIVWIIKATLQIASQKLNFLELGSLSVTWWRGVPICDMVERLKAVVIWRQVNWIKPLPDMVKVNTDGSYVMETGRASIGGVVRNENGDLIMAFSIPIQSKSNNLGEAAVGTSTFYHSFQQLSKEEIWKCSCIVKSLPYYLLKTVCKNLASNALEVSGTGADMDIVFSSVQAYVGALNKVLSFK